MGVAVTRRPTTPWDEELAFDRALRAGRVTDTTSSGPTYTLEVPQTPAYEFHECPCKRCECPQVTESGGECLSCRTGHHEAEE